MCVYIYMWVKCFFIETSWSQFLFLVSYVFWSLQQLTFSNKAHVHCLDLILQIFSTDTSYLVLKDTSRIPSPFSRPLDVFASLEDLWPFQTPQTNMIYSVLLQNKPEDLSKLLEKKCGEKKTKTARLYNMSAAETIETHAKALTDTQCSFPVRRYQQPQHEGLSQTRVCVIYN